MKRLILTACCFAALFVSCSEKPGPETDDGQVNLTGDITFTASIENCVTKATITNTGEARWEGGETFSLVLDDNSTATFTLDGTGGTRRAFFKGTIPEGRTAGSFAILYPEELVSTITSEAITINLPATATVGTSIQNSIMIAPIQGSEEITFNQLMSYMIINISNIPSEARKIELVSDKGLSGSYTVNVSDALVNGITAKEGDTKISYSLSAAPEKNLTIYPAVPVGSYSSMTLKVCDELGEEILSSDLISATTTLERAGIRTFNVELDDYTVTYPPIDGCVNVSGIYWATGNLQYKKDDGDEGFQTGWRIAPNQWHFFNYDDYEKYDKSRPTMNKDAYNHFNFGGIGNALSHETGFITGKKDLDICGKMYTDASATTATKEFTQARYGDLAYWASNGKFRLPTKKEMNTLCTEASYQAGYYTTGNIQIHGYLFTTPSGGKRTTSDDEIALTDDDLAKGLFLPMGGRRANTSSSVFINVNSQGTYWTGHMTGESTVEILHTIYNKGLTWQYTNTNFTTAAGFLIRPVLVSAE